MERSLQRFVRLLRVCGMRVSVTEALDAMRAAAQPGALTDRETLRCMLRITLLKDRGDEALFDELFDRYFRLEPIAADGPHGHSHAHDDLADSGEAQSFTMSDEPPRSPQLGHAHGKPADIRDFFRPEDLAARYNLHQEANKIDLAALTDEIVLSRDSRRGSSVDPRIQLETSRLRGAGAPGRLSRSTGVRLDADLTVAEEQLLLDWLAEEEADLGMGTFAPPLMDGSLGVVAKLPEALKRHLEALAAMDRRAFESPVAGGPRVDRIGEADRRRIEETLRRLARTMPGALTQRRKIAGRGRVDPARTMRANMRYDGVPFRPVTVARKEDKPRLVVLVDVSLSVRRTARFTLYLVHGLQRLFAQVRTFVFVADLVEITDLFDELPVERALDVVLGGDALDVDENSDYGAALGRFSAEYASAVTPRTTVVVLGDGRGNGNDPNLASFEDIARSCRRLIWLTPEPRQAWRLGRCDLLHYAELCDRVHVVRDIAGLDRVADEMVTGGGGSSRRRRS